MNKCKTNALCLSLKLNNDFKSCNILPVWKYTRSNWWYVHMTVSTFHITTKKKNNNTLLDSNDPKAIRQGDLNGSHAFYKKNAITGGTGHIHPYPSIERTNHWIQKKGQNSLAQLPSLVLVMSYIVSTRLEGKSPDPNWRKGKSSTQKCAVCW